jgi:asparagine synthase (glutamine-hydrolysing)
MGRSTITSELRRRARLSVLARDSDAETVLAAFAVWGYECVDLLNGMFAFFVWDAAAKRRGFAMRDRLGVKPLAYAWDGLEFVFASEANVVARALRGRCGRTRTPCSSTWWRRASAGWSGRCSPGSRTLQPGQLAPSSGRGRADGAPLLSLRGGDQDRGSGPAAALRGAFERAVRRACRADEPLGGVFERRARLDGDRGGRGEVLWPRLRAYSIVFAGMQEFDYRALDDRRLRRHGIRPGSRREATGVDWRAVQVPRGGAGGGPRAGRDDERRPARVGAGARAGPPRPRRGGDRAKGGAGRRRRRRDALRVPLPARPGGDREPAGDPPALRRGARPPRRARGPAGGVRDRYSAWMRPGADAEEQIAGTTSADRRALAPAPAAQRGHPRHARRPRGAGALRRHRAARARGRGLAAAGLADGEKTRLRGALRGVVPEAIRTRRKSALPKDQGAAAVYQREAARLLADPPALVRALVDLDALRPLLDPSRPLGEWERAALFRVIVLCHFSHHHGIP